MTWFFSKCIGMILDHIDERFPGGLWTLAGGCLATAVTLWFIHGSYQLALNKKKIRNRQRVARQTVKQMREKLLTKKVDIRITTLPFKVLQQKLQSGELSASEVLLAFQNKALEAQDELNCVTEFIAGAEERAAELDSLSPEDRGPLHGIPISLKETVGVKGTDCTAGVACFIGEHMESNAVLLQMVMKQGCIPFVRTNVSQGQMSSSCYNPIYGETRNPVQKHRTCGGSSGGEGALIGAGASVLGIGCDMAGSNRIPSHFCGVVGFKVTSDRLSNAGNFSMGSPARVIAEVYSPLGRDVDAVVACMRATLHPDFYTLDPFVPPVPWREKIYTKVKPMRIGYYTSFGGVEPVPAVVRAVMEAKGKLEAMGHTCVEYTPPDILDVFEHLCMSIILGDGGETAREFLKHDVVDAGILATLTLYRFPLIVRRLLSRLGASNPAEMRVIATKIPSKISEWWKKNEDKENYTRKIAEEWKNLGVEALICPPFPFAAWPLGKDSKAIVGLLYTMLYNVVDFPCGVLPATRVQAEDLENMKNYPAANALDKYIHEITRGTEGLPIGVQCVSLPFHEEALLRLMKDLEGALQFE